MYEIEALKEALVIIRQVSRGAVTQITQKWAFEQMEFLMKRIQTLEEEVFKK